jgi:hypothetical protein
MVGQKALGGMDWRRGLSDYEDEEEVGMIGL